MVLEFLWHKPSESCQNLSVKKFAYIAALFVVYDWPRKDSCFVWPITNYSLWWNLRKCSASYNKVNQI